MNNFTFILLIFLFLFLGPRRRGKPERGLRLNVLTQNGYIYNRLTETADKVVWKCALNKCMATFTTNRMLRVIDNQKNKHAHDKNAYEPLKKSLQTGKR